MTLTGNQPARRRTLTKVWDKNDGHGYGNYRIPCIVATQRGTLLACCEARRDGGDWDPIDIVFRRSEDGGASWSENLILARGVPDGVTINNPVLIPDGGFVHLLYCENYARVFYRRSTDDGRTWSEPREITADTRPAHYARNLIATGPGHGLAHSNGTLICPVWMTTGEPGCKLHRPSDIAALYSKDRGETWQIGEALYSTADLPDMSEASAAELSDGRVMLNIRSESAKRRRAVAVSPDGHSNWSSPALDEALPDPVCCGSLLGCGDALLFCNAASELSRENLTLRRSYDDGQTWQDSLVIDPGAAQYSDIAVLGDTVYVLYEKHPDIWLATVDSRNESKGEKT